MNATAGALETEIAVFHQKTAATCNNAAWELIETPDLSGSELVRLVSLASTARYHCQAVGTESQIAHATLLFGWALARVGAGEEALLSAQEALDFFQDYEGKDWELAFAHAAMAAACRASGLSEGYARHHGEAECLSAHIPEKTLPLFKAAFGNLPVPVEAQKA